MVNKIKSFAEMLGIYFDILQNESFTIHRMDLVHVNMEYCIHNHTHVLQLAVIRHDVWYLSPPFVVDT